MIMDEILINGPITIAVYCDKKPKYPHHCDIPGIVTPFEFGDYKNIKKRDIVYLHVVNKGVVIFVHHILPYLPDDSDLTMVISNDGDVFQPDPSVQVLLASPKIHCVYAYNVVYSHPKLHPLPLGVWPVRDTNEFYENNRRGISNIPIYKEAYDVLITERKNAKPTVEREKKVYCCWHDGTDDRRVSEGIYKISRKDIRAFVSSYPDIFDLFTNVPKYDVYIQMAQYSFCLCPFGNGLDTFRLWESFYLGCIPIMFDNPMKEYLKGLPCIYIHNIEDLLTLDYEKEQARFGNLLENKYIENLSNIKYIIKQIREGKSVFNF